MPIIHFNLLEGRTVQQKRELARRVSEVVSEVLDVKRETIRILIHELTAEDFSIAGMTAGERAESNAGLNGNGQDKHLTLGVKP